MGLVLLLLLGVVKMSLVGYEQAEADGAAFVAARAASLTTNTAQQASRGETHAGDIFTDVPSANLSVTPSTGSGGTNGQGSVVASAFRLTNGLFSGPFGSGDFTLQSHLVEPVTTSGTNSSSVNSLTIGTSALQNCVSANPATPVCPSGGLPIYLAQYQPGSSNPWSQFQCHETIYKPLANGTSGTGTVAGAHPWPEDYQPTTDGSINWPAIRQGGLYLTVSGGLGTLLAPMYNFSSTNPCGTGNALSG
jgi:Flp pilus assembly protein TadG